MKDGYAENYKILEREVKDLKNCRDTMSSQIQGLKIVSLRCQFFPNGIPVKIPGEIFVELITKRF